MRPKLRAQAGFLMPLALFVVLAIASLAFVMTKSTGGSFNAAVQEAVSVQSFYAAESGAQYALHKLLFDTNTAAEMTDKCARFGATKLPFSVPGLDNCSAYVRCAVHELTAGEPAIVTLKSSGECGGGDLKARRTLAYSVGLQSSMTPESPATARNVWLGDPRILFSQEILDTP